VGLVSGNTVRASVCTASEALAARLRDMLLRWAAAECVLLEVDTAKSPAGKKSQGAELLFLDMDSVELPERGRAAPDKGLIVISRDAGRAIRSYRWHPAAFLKPEFDMHRLSEAMSACEKHWQSGRICLESPYRRRAFTLPLGRIRYVEASSHYCLFNQGRQFVRFRYSVNEAEELLPKPPFARCHRSYLVHLDAVADISYSKLTLRDGVILPMGRTYIDSVREALRLWREGELSNVDIHSGL
jgi:DNA-binding LytR/AlgR family response regulator